MSLIEKFCPHIAPPQKKIMIKEQLKFSSKFPLFFNNCGDGDDGDFNGKMKKYGLVVGQPEWWVTVTSALKLQPPSTLYVAHCKCKYKISQIHLMYKYTSF